MPFAILINYIPMNKSLDNLMKSIPLFILLNLFSQVLLPQQPLKPFPQHVLYNTGVIKPSHVSQQQMDDSVRSFYDSWKLLYLRKDAGKGQYYVWVKGSAGTMQSVSEGQGYGMIIVSLMAGYDTASQKIYDGLFAYYKAHPTSSSKYLMAWSQTKTFKDQDGSSATDGDMDIAYSLLLANAQWGSNGTINYLQQGQAMIAAILQQEINPVSFSVMLSNAIMPDSKDYFDTRSSDFMPAHYKAFKNFTGDSSWDKVVAANYKLFGFMQKKYSGDAGLVPDFIQHINKKPVPAKANYLESPYDGLYNYNACRVPWRIATDYILYGDERAKIMVGKINKWIKETTQGKPDNISAGYTLAGNDIHGRYFEAMSFISSFAVGAMVEKTNQTWLNKLWDYIFSFRIGEYDYYDNTIKMLELIIISGNYWRP